jgi:light-regulated signal transduction histidine kinase (bacteriophytochrome)
MSKSTVDSFFMGRALAEGLYEQLENLFTNTMSELGKFDAQQRENLRQFTQKVANRANQESQVVADSSVSSSTGATGATVQPVDLQETIDELRAEIARLRSELQRYRNPS